MTDSSTLEQQGLDASSEQTPLPYEEPAVLRFDGERYAFASLSDRARLLSSDYLKTKREWDEQQQRYEQLVAGKTQSVSALKQEVEKAGMQPVWPMAEPDGVVRPLLTIDSKSYDATTVPDSVREQLEALLAQNKACAELEYALRQLDAACTAYEEAIREELKAIAATPLPALRPQQAPAVVPPAQMAQEPSSDQPVVAANLWPAEISSTAQPVRLKPAAQSPQSKSWVWLGWLSAAQSRLRASSPNPAVLMLLGAALGMGALHLVQQYWRPAMQPLLASASRYWQCAASQGPAPTPAASQAIAPVPAPVVPLAKPPALQLSSAQPNWLEVRSAKGGALLYQGVFKGNKSFPVDAGLSVRSGRPDLLMVRQGQAKPKPLGTINEVRWVSFKPTLPAQAAAAAPPQP